MADSLEAQRVEALAPLKVLMLSKTAGRLGACRAGYRLFTEFQADKDLEVFFASCDPVPKDTETQVYLSSWRNILGSKISSALDRLPVTFTRGSKGSLFTYNWLAQDNWLELYRRLRPDLLHLHWAGQGLIKPEQLAAIRCPVVWTLHDLWPLTGGCHYTDGCESYRRQCGQCPQLSSGKQNDLSFSGLKSKRDAYKGLEMHWVAPSNWMMQQAHKSSLVDPRKLYRIANGVDTRIIIDHDKVKLRQMLGLRKNAFVVLSGAQFFDQDIRKGFSLFKQLMRILGSGPVEDVEFISFGHTCIARDQWDQESVFHRRYGHVQDEFLLQALYRACDVFVSLSSEENLPQTVIEAMLMGAIPIAFNIGGMLDIVEEAHNGFLVDCGNVQLIAQRIQMLSGNPHMCQKLSLSAQQKVKACFDVCNQKNEYKKLYQQITSI